MKKNIDIIKVETVSIKKEKLDNSIRTLGTLSYSSKHNVSSLVSGRLEKINVKEGDYVKKGQVLGQLRNLQLENQKEMYVNNLIEAEAALLIAEDNFRDEKLKIEKQLVNLDKLKIQINQAKMEYEHKRKCLENNLELYEIGGLSELKIKEEELNLIQTKTSIELMQKEYEINSIGYRDEDIKSLGYWIPENSKERDELLITMNSKQAFNIVMQERARVDTVKKNILNLEYLMEELKVRATVSGIVANCNFQTGDHISENETCFILFDASVINGVFYIQEQEIYKYQIYSKLNISIPSINQVFETSISEISPVADPVSGNFCVKAPINNFNNELKPGMFINCILSDNNEKEYFTIPESCIVRHVAEEPTVLCVSGNHVFYKNIKIYCQRNGIVYIENGIKENDVIVNRPSFRLKEGDEVEIQ